MKKFLIVLLLMPSIAMAIEFKSFNALTSQSVATTSGTVSQITQLDEPFSKITCDFLDSSATGTGTISVYYSASSVTPFSTNAAILTSGTKTAGSILTFSAVDKVFRNIVTNYAIAVGSAQTVSMDCVAQK